MKMVSLRILLALSLLLGLGTANLVWAEAPGTTLPANLKIEQWKGLSSHFLLCRQIDKLLDTKFLQ